MLKNLHVLPKIRDSWGYLYAEHCRIDKEDKAIVIHDKEGRVPVPCATLSLLMLGPGTLITHAAVMVLAEVGCLVVWCGEQGIRFYAQGMGDTRSSSALLRQAQIVLDPDAHLAAVIRMYQFRFEERLAPDLSLQQIRGKEGARVRAAYARLSKEYGVEWSGRSYDRTKWSRADDLNRALSVANSCLYGLCHAAIVSLGLSPALGFIHTGKQLSFVYDVADLYKVDTTIPVAFQESSLGSNGLEGRVRRSLRDLFYRERLLGRIVSDLQDLLCFRESVEASDVDASLPGGLWDPEGVVSGGQNQEDEAQ